MKFFIAFGSFTMLQAVIINRSFVMQSTNPFQSFVSSFGKPTSPSKKLSSVAITGATGLVGTELIKKFEKENINVIKISTRSLNDENFVKWNPSLQSIDDIEKLEGVDAFIHLAGENVASGEGPFAFLGAWSETKKQKIMKSRVDGTKLVVDTISKLKKKPKVLISASGAGFYGFKDSETFFDESFRNKGPGFLAEVCESWESEAKKAEKLGVRVVSMRLAPIFSTKAGLLKKLLPIFQLGAGGNVGSGSQGFSWVSLNDVVRAILFLLETNGASGPINVCSPNPVTNADFTQAMGSALNRPAIVPVPEIAASTIFGEMGQEMLLGGQKTVPKKLTSLGFKFEDVDLVETIKNIVKTSA